MRTRVDTRPKVMVSKFSTITIQAHTVFTQTNENENKLNLTNILTKILTVIIQHTVTEAAIYSF